MPDNTQRLDIQVSAGLTADTKLLIDDDLNSNPFTRLFRKHNLKYVLMFFITCLIMVGIYVGLIYWVYKGVFDLKNTFEILGNGFYWILAGIVYWLITRIFKGGTY